MANEEENDRDDAANDDEAEETSKPEAKEDEPKPEAKEEPKPEVKEEPKPEVKEEPKPEVKEEPPPKAEKKEEPKKVEAKKEEPKKAETKPAEPKKAEPKKAEAKKAEPKKASQAVSSPPPVADAQSAHAHHKPDRRQYFVIWGWLFGLTVLEVGVAYMRGVLGKVPLVTALVGLALAKATCVALFYMHLKHETKVMRWTVALPLLFPALYAFILIAEGIYRSLWGGGA